MDSTPAPGIPVIAVDDEPGVLRAFETMLRLGGITDVTCCSDSRHVLSMLESRDRAVVLLDLTMPHLSGEELLPGIRKDFPEVAVIVVTGSNDVKTALRCMKGGAVDYMVKPVERNRLCSGVARAAELIHLRHENKSLRQAKPTRPAKEAQALEGIVARGRQMRAALHQAEALAASPRPILITGEPGVGKRTLARAMHELSGRLGGFASLDVKGMDQTAFCETVFGRVDEGAARAQLSHSGLLTDIGDGTLFLHGIRDLDRPSQARLLRLVQEREYVPMGSYQAVHTDVRVIVAAGPELAEHVQRGEFRKDLYLRLRAYHIDMPPLRERVDDIPALTERFIAEAARALDKEPPAAAPGLLPALYAYDFPGNIAELEQVLFAAVEAHRFGPLTADAFLACTRDSYAEQDPESEPERVPFGLSDAFPTLKDATSFLIAEALRRSRGNQSAAARLLGISAPALNKRLKRLRERHARGTDAQEELTQSE